MSSTMREYHLLILSGTITMVSGGLVWSIFAPYVRTEFTAPIILIGLAVSSYFMIRMFSEFPIGILSDRMGSRTPLIIGRSIAVIGTFMCYTASDIWQLIVGRSLWGVGDAAFYCIGMSYVTLLFSGEKRGRALGAFQAVEMIGLFLGQSLGGLMTAAIDIKTNFLVSSVLGVVSLLLISMIRFERSFSTEAPHEMRLLHLKTVLKVFNPAIIFACFAIFVCMMRNNGVNSTILPLYVIEEVKLPLTQFGFMLASSTIGSVIGNVLGGSLSDKMGRKKVLASSFLLAAFSTLLLTTTNSFLGFLLVMFLDGIAWGSVYGTIPALVADYVPNETRGMGIGIFRTFFDFGGLVGPIAFSGVAEFIGGSSAYTTVFYFGAGLMLLNLIMIRRFKEIKTKARAPFLCVGSSS